MIHLCLLCLLLLTACGAAPPSPDRAQAATLERRAFAPTVEGKPVFRGVSYGPFREGQKPGGPNPSAEQILEDLQIIAQDWQMIRMYSTGEPTETILRTIRDNKLPLVVMMGAWIAADDAAANEREVTEAIRLANAYPDVVAAVNIGNETQVFWSGHKSDREQLIGYLTRVRAAIKQPVTTADDYNFWNKPESKPVAAVVDFIALHAYAMWNGKQLDDAVTWTAEVVESIRVVHPGLTIVLSETGWATALNPEGEENKHIKAPAGEAEQARFFKDFTAWTTAEKLPHFYFEAFDEPWKGSADPREVEKHWGLYHVDRTPKKAMRTR